MKNRGRGGVQLEIANFPGDETMAVEFFASKNPSVRNFNEIFGAVIENEKKNTHTVIARSMVYGLWLRWLIWLPGEDRH